MRRKIEQWRDCDPRTMATQMSQAAMTFAIEDAKADILELYAENQRLRNLIKDKPGKQYGPK